MNQAMNDAKRDANFATDAILPLTKGYLNDRHLLGTSRQIFLVSDVSARLPWPSSGKRLSIGDQKSYVSGAWKFGTTGYFF